MAESVTRFDYFSYEFIHKMVCILNIDQKEKKHCSGMIHFLQNFHFYTSNINDYTQP